MGEIASLEEATEETGWKLVHGDVFRKPAHSKLLAVSIGSGVQIFLMSVVTLTLSFLGLLSPAHRGAILQSTMLLYTFMGIAAGYVNSRLYKSWGGVDWKQTTLLCAFLYPGIFFTIFFILNLFIWGQKSSGAVPFTTLFAVLCLWFGISVPLVFLGAYFGFKQPSIENPTRTNQIPRQIPKQPWFIQPALTIALGVFLYAVFYFMTRLQIEKAVSTLLYFGYMSLLTILFALLTGSVGSLASLFFVRAIYGSIKID